MDREGKCHEEPVYENETARRCSNRRRGRCRDQDDAGWSRVERRRRLVGAALQANLPHNSCMSRPPMAALGPQGPAPIPHNSYMTWPPLAALGPQNLPPIPHHGYMSRPPLAALDPQSLAPIPHNSCITRPPLAALDPQSLAPIPHNNCMTSPPLAALDPLSFSPTPQNSCMTRPPLAALDPLSLAPIPHNSCMTRPPLAALDSQILAPIPHNSCMSRPPLVALDPQGPPPTPAPVTTPVTPPVGAPTQLPVHAFTMEAPTSSANGATLTSSQPPGIVAAAARSPTRSPSALRWPVVPRCHKAAFSKKITDTTATKQGEVAVCAQNAEGDAGCSLRPPEAPNEPLTTHLEGLVSARWPVLPRTCRPAFGSVARGNTTTCKRNEAECTCSSPQACQSSLTCDEENPLLENAILLRNRFQSGNHSSLTDDLLEVDQENSDQSFDFQTDPMKTDVKTIIIQRSVPQEHTLPHKISAYDQKQNERSLTSVDTHSPNQGATPGGPVQTHFYIPPFSKRPKPPECTSFKCDTLPDPTVNREGCQQEGLCSSVASQWFIKPLLDSERQEHITNSTEGTNCESCISSEAPTSTLNPKETAPQVMNKEAPRLARFTRYCKRPFLSSSRRESLPTNTNTKWPTREYWAYNQTPYSGRHAHSSPYTGPPPWSESSALINSLIIATGFWNDQLKNTFDYVSPQNYSYYGPQDVYYYGPQDVSGNSTSFDNRDDAFFTQMTNDERLYPNANERFDFNNSGNVTQEEPHTRCSGEFKYSIMPSQILESSTQSYDITFPENYFLRNEKNKIQQASFPRDPLQGAPCEHFHGNDTLCGQDAVYLNSDSQYGTTGNNSSLYLTSCTCVRPAATFEPLVQEQPEQCLFQASDGSPQLPHNPSEEWHVVVRKHRRQSEHKQGTHQLGSTLSTGSHNSCFDSTCRPHTTRQRPFCNKKQLETISPSVSYNKKSIPLYSTSQILSVRPINFANDTDQKSWAGETNNLAPPSIVKSHSELSETCSQCHKQREYSESNRNQKICFKCKTFQSHNAVSSRLPTSVLVFLCNAIRSKNKNMQNKGKIIKFNNGVRYSLMTSKILKISIRVLRTALSSTKLDYSIHKTRCNRKGMSEAPVGLNRMPQECCDFNRYHLTYASDCGLSPGMFSDNVFGSSRMCRRQYTQQCTQTDSIICQDSKKYEETESSTQTTNVLTPPPSALECRRDDNASPKTGRNQTQKRKITQVNMKSRGGVPTNVENITFTPPRSPRLFPLSKYKMLRTLGWHRTKMSRRFGYPRSTRRLHIDTPQKTAHESPFICKCTCQYPTSHTHDVAVETNPEALTSEDKIRISQQNNSFSPDRTSSNICPNHNFSDCFPPLEPECLTTRNSLLCAVTPQDGTCHSTSHSSGKSPDNFLDFSFLDPPSSNSDSSSESSSWPESSSSSESAEDPLEWVLSPRRKKSVSRTRRRPPRMIFFHQVALHLKRSQAFLSEEDSSLSDREPPPKQPKRRCQTCKGSSRASLLCQEKQNVSKTVVTLDSEQTLFLFSNTRVCDSNSPSDTEFKMDDYDEFHMKRVAVFQGQTGRSSEGFESLPEDIESVNILTNYEQSDFQIPPHSQYGFYNIQMEMLSTLNALAGKISPQSGTDSNANKVSIQNNNNNNNTSPHPHPYSKPAPPVPASSASTSPASNAYGDSKLPPANGACSSPEIMCYKRSSYAVLKRSSTVSVYWDAAAEEPLFDPALVGLIYERRREICLELFDTLVRFHAEILEPHYEVIRDTLLEADVPVQDQYDQACSFYLDDATTHFDQIVMSTSYVVPLDQRFFRCYERLQQTVAILWNIYRNYTRRYSVHNELGIFNKLCEHPGASSGKEPNTENKVSECSLQDFEPESEIIQIDRQRKTRLPDLLFKTCKQVEALVQFLEFYQYVKERRILDETIARSQPSVQSNEKFVCSREILRACAQLGASQYSQGTASHKGKTHQAPKEWHGVQSLPVFEDPILEQLRIQLENTCRNRSKKPLPCSMRDSELDILMIQKMESLYRFIDSGSGISIGEEEVDLQKTEKTDMQDLERKSPQIEEVTDTPLMNDNAEQDSLQECLESLDDYSRNDPDVNNSIPNSHERQLESKLENLQEESINNVLYELIDTSFKSVLEYSSLDHSLQSSLDQEDMYSANTSYAITSDFQTNPADESSPHETQGTYDSIDNACFEELLMSDVTDVSSTSDFKCAEEDIENIHGEYPAY